MTPIHAPDPCDTCRACDHDGYQCWATHAGEHGDRAAALIARLARGGAVTRRELAATLSVDLPARVRGLVPIYDLSGADLSEANLRGANLYGTSLRFRGVNLREAIGYSPPAPAGPP